MANQRAFLDSIGSQIGVKGNDLSPWYQIDKNSFRRLCGGKRKLVKFYGDSLYAMLKAVYPEYDWLPWKFKMLPTTSISEKGISEKALKYLETELKIARPELWYEVSYLKLRELGLATLVSSLGGLPQLLKQLRSEHTWVDSKFIGIRQDPLKLLLTSTREIFPHEEILVGFELGPSRVSLCIPSLRLVFDYQSVRDYGLAKISGDVNVHFRANEAKSEAAMREGLILITVPFWWDRSAMSLAATIQNRLSDFKDDNNTVKRALDSLGDFGSGADPIPLTTTAKLSAWRNR